MKIKKLPVEVGEVSETFQCAFENSGIMKDGIIYTMKTVPDYHGKQITLGDVMETGQVEEQYFIPEEKLYYTDPTVTHSDETDQCLSSDKRAAAGSLCTECKRCGKPGIYCTGSKKNVCRSGHGNAIVY